MRESLADGLDVCVTVTHLDGLVLARSAFHHSANYRCVVVHGRARLVTDATEKDEALRHLVDAIVPGRSDHVRGPSRRELAATAVLRLDLDGGLVQEPRRRAGRRRGGPRPAVVGRRAAAAAVGAPGPRARARPDRRHRGPRARHGLVARLTPAPIPGCDTCPPADHLCGGQTADRASRTGRRRAPLACPRARGDRLVGLPRRLAPRRRSAVPGRRRARRAGRAARRGQPRGPAGRTTAALALVVAPAAGRVRAAAPPAAAGPPAAVRRPDPGRARGLRRVHERGDGLGPGRGRRLLHRGEGDVRARRGLPRGRSGSSSSLLVVMLALCAANTVVRDPAWRTSSSRPRRRSRRPTRAGTRVTDAEDTGDRRTPRSRPRSCTRWSTGCPPAGPRSATPDGPGA